MSDNVLREFLVSLGFKIDEAGLKKFETSVEGVTKSVMNIGAGIAAAATGVVAGVKIISSQMENLYYASQRTGATVGNIMALRYAAGQIGLSADQAQGALENFARTLRLNPGSGGLLDSLGVKGGDPAERFTSFIEKMKGMQPYVAAAYAGLFGIDPDTLLMLENGLPKLEDEKKKYASKLAAFGIDPDQAAEAGKDFNNSIRAVKDTFNDLWIVIESKLAPVLTPLVAKFEEWAETNAGDVAQGIADAVGNLATWIQSVDWKKVGNDFMSVYRALGGLEGILIGLAAIKLAPLVTGVLNLAAAVTRLGAAASGGAIGGLLKVLGPIALLFHSEDLNKGEDEKLDDIRKKEQWAAAHGGWTPEMAKPGWEPPANNANTDDADAYGGSSPPGATSKSSTAELFSQLESKWGLPKGLLDSDWFAESSRGKNMLSPSGARGHFGFMPATAKEYGLLDPDDLVESAKAAAHKFADLVRHYAGDIYKAIAGYNWGEGNLDKAIGKFGGDWFAHVPKETFDYVNRVTSGMGAPRLGSNGGSAVPVSIQQKYTFHIDGSSDPHGTARAVSGEQSRVNGDLVRNFAGAFR